MGWPEYEECVYCSGDTHDFYSYDLVQNVDDAACGPDVVSRKDCDAFFPSNRVAIFIEDITRLFGLAFEVAPFRLDPSFCDSCYVRRIGSN